jgi:hypothetical protein
MTASYTLCRLQLRADADVPTDTAVCDETAREIICTQPCSQEHILRHQLTCVLLLLIFLYLPLLLLLLLLSTATPNTSSSSSASTDHYITAEPSGIASIAAVAQLKQWQQSEQCYMYKIVLCRHLATTSRSAFSSPRACLHHI